jgi:hypothetical protein
MGEVAFLVRRRRRLLRASGLANSNRPDPATVKMQNQCRRAHAILSMHGRAHAQQAALLKPRYSTDEGRIQVGMHPESANTRTT